MAEYDIAVTMAMTLGTMIAGIGGLALLQTKKKGDGSSFIPIQQPSKRAYELYVLTYTPIWILAFGCIVAFGWYQDVDELSYMKVCVGLALLVATIPFTIGGIWISR
jgi:hypothetical protein